MELIVFPVAASGDHLTYPCAVSEHSEGTTVERACLLGLCSTSWGHHAPIPPPPLREPFTGTDRYCGRRLVRSERASSCRHRTSTGGRSSTSSPSPRRSRGHAVAHSPRLARMGLRFCKQHLSPWDARLATHPLRGLAYRERLRPILLFPCHPLHVRLLQPQTSMVGS
jgi:hypothetical protein